MNKYMTYLIEGDKYKKKIRSDYTLKGWSDLISYLSDKLCFTAFDRNYVFRVKCVSDS